MGFGGWLRNRRESDGKMARLGWHIRVERRYNEDTLPDKRPAVSCVGRFYKSVQIDITTGISNVLAKSQISSLAIPSRGQCAYRHIQVKIKVASDLTFHYHRHYHR
jgi:hypothetical protein